MNRIMLVDDEKNILNALRRVLMGGVEIEGESVELSVEIFDSPSDALRRAEVAAFDLVISDYRMPEMGGVEFLKAFRKIQPNAARMVLSGYADFAGLMEAINEAEIYRFISKPWNDYDLKFAISQALSFRKLLMENQRLADIVRMQQGQLSKQELALRRLEEESPGITKVNWGADGSVIIDENDV
ncbi:response regulator [Sulfuriferula thiophila]|uniref:response regulator n=1 Tax=Sulfuriferula thiophila TaxID=1781211 RepID=UPI000F614999|nr:response regulator [Sulfuriferula thiophila]